LVPKICQYWKEVLQCDGQPKLILVQLSRVLAELSKRLWPQCWKSFTDDVLSSLQTGKSQLLVGLLTLQGLGDDLLGPEQKVKDKERKKQLMAALRADIIRFSDFFRNILQNVSDMEVLKTTLEALTTYIGWMPMGAVFSGESGREITDCLLKVLYIAPLRTAGADCLLILASRKDSYAHAKEMRTKTIDWFFSNFPVLLEVIRYFTFVVVWSWADIPPHPPVVVWSWADMTPHPPVVVWSWADIPPHPPVVVWSLTDITPHPPVVVWS
jgi:hypothetical protein